MLPADKEYQHHLSIIHFHPDQRLGQEREMSLSKLMMKKRK
jgi:hypothetical protein